METLYKELAAKCGQGARAPDILKTLAPDVYGELVKKYGTPRYRHFGGLSSADIYHHLQPTAPRTCLQCGKPTKYVNFKYGYKRYCNRECCHASGNQHSQNIAKTILANHGVTAPAKSKKVLAKMRRTTRRRHGVDWAQQSAAVRRKVVQTNLRKRGVANVMQDRKVFETNIKAQHRCEDVIRRGRRFKNLQGYEPLAIDFILSEFPIGPSMFEDPLGIPYWENNKQRVYHPDFKVGKLIIEVKSDYTAGFSDNHKGKQRNLIAKLKGAQAAGYDFLLLVMNKDGTLNCCCFNSFKVAKDVSQFAEPIVAGAYASN